MNIRDIEQMFLVRDFKIAHCTINSLVLAQAPVIERVLGRLSNRYRGSVRIDEIYVNMRCQWRYLYGAVDRHGNRVDFMLTGTSYSIRPSDYSINTETGTTLASGKIGPEVANTCTFMIKTAVNDERLLPDPVHYVTKHLQQVIESNHFRVKKKMSKFGGFQSFNTALVPLWVLKLCLD